MNDRKLKIDALNLAELFNEYTKIVHLICEISTNAVLDPTL